MTSTQEEEDERIQAYYDQAVLDFLSKPREKTEEDIKKDQRNAANKAYYAANKTKILKDRKKSKTENRKKECDAKGIPYYLAEFISFHANGKTTLKFDTLEDLAKTLHWLKFKSNFGEEILEIGKQ